MDIVKQWINNPQRKYRDGLAIYHKIKRNKEKDAFFNAVSDAPAGSLHFNLLIQEVKNAYRVLLSKGEQFEDKPKPPAPGKPITTAPLKLDKKLAVLDQKPSSSSAARFVHNSLVEVTSLPEDLQQKFFRNQEITRELSGLHQQLKASKTDQDRALVASQIDVLFHERQTNWTQIDQFAGVDASLESTTKESTIEDGLHGPEGQNELAKQMLESKKRLDTVKINISRVEKELQSKELTPAKIRSRKSRLKAWKEELSELEMALSGL